MELIAALEPYTRTEVGAIRGRPLASDPVALRTLLSQLVGLGIRRFLCPTDRHLLAALRGVSAATRTPVGVDALLVNAAVVSREMQTYGAVGVARRMLRDTPVAELPGLGMAGLRDVLALAKKDLGAAVGFLCRSEIARFRGLRLRSVLLHYNTVDLAVANRNRRPIDSFLKAAQRARVTAGLATNNGGRLLPLLDEWNTDLRVVAAVIASSGYHMKPTRTDCEVALKRTQARVIGLVPAPASRVSAAEIDYVRSVGADVASFAFDDAPSAMRVLDMMGGAAP